MADLTLVKHTFFSGSQGESMTKPGDPNQPWEIFRNLSELCWIWITGKR